MSEFSTHMVYFSTPTFVLNAVKEPGIFWGGCMLIKAFWTGSQWVNASQIAFNIIIISPTHTPCKIVGISKRSLIFGLFGFDLETSSSQIQYCIAHDSRLFCFLLVKYLLNKLFHILLCFILFNSCSPDLF